MMCKMPATINTVETACPLCHATAAQPWGEENGFTAVKCEECGLIYVNPRPRTEEIAEATVMGQHHTKDGTIDVVFRRKPSRIKRYRRLIGSMFADRLASPLEWLDIGAGFGEFVEALASIFPKGSRIEGIEPMQAKARIARNLGLPIRSCHLSDVTDRYDVVSLVNVFGHIPDFHEFLHEIRARLKTGGELFLQTGNAGDLASAAQYPDDLYLPDHLVFAGMHHVRRFLADGGFEIISTHAARVDGFVNATKNALNRAIGKRARLFLPYASPFRTVSYRARVVA